MSAWGMGHLALYLLPLAVILIGWAETDFGGHSVKWFGIAMPKLFPTMDMLWGFELEEVTEALHELLTYTMLRVVVIHIAAVIKHQWFGGWNILYRMGFGKSR